MIHRISGCFKKSVIGHITCMATVTTSCHNAGSPFLGGCSWSRTTTTKRLGNAVGCFFFVWVSNLDWSTSLLFWLFVFRCDHSVSSHVDSESEEKRNPRNSSQAQGKSFLNALLFNQAANKMSNAFPSFILTSFMSSFNPHTQKENEQQQTLQQGQMEALRLCWFVSWSGVCLRVYRLTFKPNN